MDKTSDKVHLISEWVNLFGDDLFRWAIHKVSHKEIAEDLVQETFFTAFHKVETFKGKSSPKTWLFSILKNKVIDYHRKNFRQKTYHYSDIQQDKDQILGDFFTKDGSWKKNSSPLHWHNSEDRLVDDAEFQHALQNCMNRLPDAWRSAMELKYLEEKKGDEICQALGVSSSNYWQIIHRAKIQLRDCLEKNWFSL